MSRYLILRPGAIGDGIVSLPVVQRIKEAQLDASIELVAGGAAASLLRGRCVADVVSDFDDLRWAGLFAQPLPPDLYRHLARLTAIIFYLGQPPEEMAARIQGQTGARTIVWPSQPPDETPHPISMHLQAPLAPLGIQPRAQAPALTLTPADQAFAGAYWDDHGLSKTGGPVIALHPGSGSPRKNWPARRFAELAQRLTHEHDARVLVVAGPADEDPLRDLLSRWTASPPVVARDRSLAEIAALLARCRLVIGNDSGISHLAAALGAPTITLFGPTDPRVWAPQGATPAVIACPDALPGCEMDAITVDQAYATAHTHLT